VVEVVAVRLVVEEVLAQEVSPTLRVRKLRSRRLKVFTVSSVMLNAWIICISFAGAFSMYATSSVEWCIIVERACENFCLLPDTVGVLHNYSNEYACDSDCSKSRHKSIDKIIGKRQGYDQKLRSCVDYINIPSPNI